MKNIIVMVCCIFFSVDICADAKWIPIEPIKPIENYRQDKNTSSQKPVNRLIENAKVIQYLLDKGTDKEKSDKENSKNWYIFDTQESE